MDSVSILFNIIWEVIKFMFVHDADNMFYAVSVFVVMSIIVIMVLMSLLGKKYND